MAAIVQKGETLKIGFGDNTYTGYIMQDFTKESTGEQDVIKDENNATVTVLVSDQGYQIGFTAIIKDSGSIIPPDQGDSITIDSVAYRVLSASVKQTSKASELTISAIKEDSMSYV